jgi:CheY-like chemotaxis protein
MMPKTILYVDDEPWFVESLIDSLRDAQYYVETAVNGTEAIKRLSGKDILPDLVVLDIIMPTGELIEDVDGGRRTGLRVHEIIRKQLQLAVPIIFVSVIDDPAVEREIENIEKNSKVRNFAYLVKPVLPTELLEKVSIMLNAPMS